MRAATSTLARAAVLAAALALGTVVAGWWAVPVLGAAWGWMDRGGARTVRTAALAGALAWCALLVWDAAGGPLAGLAATLGGVMRLPGWTLLLLTDAYAAALAAAAAATVRGLLAPPRSTRAAA